MNSITTHVLDTTRGKPAAGVPVTLVRFDAVGDVAATYTGTTNNDGRVADLIGGEPLIAGTYRITFDTAAYAASQGDESFYPHVDVTFTLTATDQHYHIPLLLSPFGYSTYRGS